MKDLIDIYKERYERFLRPIAARLETYLKDCLSSDPRMDRICARAKTVDRFMQKSRKEENGNPKYSDPLNQIYDQVGARIVTFYDSDVSRVSTGVRKYFRPVENKTLVPESENEFGYVGEHFILLFPTEVLAGIAENGEAGVFFELQIKTLFQHAWAEAEHDLGYKTSTPLTSMQKRKIAFTAAQAWGADQIFDDLYHEIHK